MRRHLNALFLVSFAAAAACSAEPNGAETSAQTHEALGPAGITSYSTNTAWVGDQITLYGNGFTTDGYTRVEFDEIQAPGPFTNTICSTTTSCTFNVPEVLNVGGTATFQVYVDGVVLPDYSGHAGVLQLKPLQMTGVSPTIVSSTGGTITITGHGFFDGLSAGQPTLAPYNTPMQVSFGSPAVKTFYPTSILCNYYPGTDCTVTLPPIPSDVKTTDQLYISINGYGEGEIEDYPTTISYANTPCQPSLCGAFECGGVRSNGCGGTVDCNYVCPTNESCSGTVCQVSTCPAHRVCPKGGTWSGPPDCECLGQPGL